MSMVSQSKIIEKWTREDALFAFAFGVIAWFLVLITTIGLASSGGSYAATVTATYLVGYPTWILLIVSRVI